MILLQNYYDGNLPTSTKWRAEEAGKLLPQSKKAGHPCERATLVCPNSCNDNAKGPGRASRRGSLRSPFGPFKRVAGMGRVVKKNQVAE